MPVKVIGPAKQRLLVGHDNIKPTFTFSYVLAQSNHPNYIF